MGICDGRVVIITGAGRGLGREHALAFAAEGAKVVVNDVGASLQGEGNDMSPAQEVVELIRESGGEAITNGDDISDWDGAGRLVQSAIDTFGGLDTVVTNAGIVRDRMFVNMSVDEWDAVIRVHLRGTFVPFYGLNNMFGLGQFPLVGLILGLIALLTSYDHINLFGHILPLPQQWGIPCIAASVATVLIDAQLATRSRLRAEHRAARAADVAAGRRSRSSSRAKSCK